MNKLKALRRQRFEESYYKSLKILQTDRQTEREREGERERERERERVSERVNERERERERERESSRHTPCRLKNVRQSKRKTYLLRKTMRNPT